MTTYDRAQIGALSLHGRLSGFLYTRYSPVRFGGTADAVPPVVTNVAPPAGAALSPTSEVGFDVTDDVHLLSPVVTVSFAGLDIYDVVHDGTNFAPRYGGSTRTAIMGGYRFRCRRVAGWPSAPVFHVHATDRSGNESI